MYKRNKKYKRLGYDDFIEIYGETMQLRYACRKFPKEVFNLITTKEILVGSAIYQNMLDINRVINPELYLKHRTPYHLKQIAKTNKLDNYELDYVVRNQLKNEKNIDRISISIKERKEPKIYSKLQEDTPGTNQNSYNISRSNWNDNTKRFKVLNKTTTTHHQKN